MNRQCRLHARGESPRVESTLIKYRRKTKSETSDNERSTGMRTKQIEMKEKIRDKKVKTKLQVRRRRGKTIMGIADGSADAGAK